MDCHEPMLRQITSAVVRRPWLRKLAVTTPGIRDLAWRFVAGEDLEAGLGAVRALAARGIRGTLNHVGTHVRAEGEARAAADMAVESLGRIHAEGLDCELSVKLTQIGLDVDEDLCRTELRRVLDRASQLGNFVCIDMEESPYVERTVRLFEEMREGYGPDTVGIVLQSYLRSRSRVLERLVERGARIRLVKGGYWEAADVAYRRRSEIDAAFLADIRVLLPSGRHPAIATHDAHAVDHALRVAAEAGLDGRAFEFQMLFGVRPDLQDALIRSGHEVRCYVPYGSGWYEYFLGCARRVPGGALRRLGDRLLRRGT